MVKVLFQFDNTPVARSTLAAALEDPTWKDAHDRPSLDIGFGMAEQDALEVLVRAMQQHGATVLVVSKPVEKVVIKEDPADMPMPVVAKKPPIKKDTDK